LDTIGAPRTQHYGYALPGDKASRGFAESAARTCDDDDFSCDAIVHNCHFRFLVFVELVS
jgi:hypothetical protein